MVEIYLRHQYSKEECCRKGSKRRDEVKEFRSGQKDCRKISHIDPKPEDIFERRVIAFEVQIPAHAKRLQARRFVNFQI